MVFSCSVVIIKFFKVVCSVIFIVFLGNVFFKVIGGSLLPGSSAVLFHFVVFMESEKLGKYILLFD